MARDKCTGNNLPTESPMSTAGVSTDFPLDEAPGMDPPTAPFAAASSVASLSKALLSKPSAVIPFAGASVLPALFSKFCSFFDSLRLALRNSFSFARLPKRN